MPPPAATPPQIQAAADYAKEHGVDLRATEMDVNSQDSVDAAVQQVIEEHGRIDVIMHNAGHMVTGPSEAFTPEQLDQLFECPAPERGGAVGSVGRRLWRRGRWSAAMTHGVSRRRPVNRAVKPLPSGEAHMMPAWAGRPGGK
ncbi:SDR family NAD(P)-dependent oxidoreductase [Streptomyces sparsogenes]|uniref:SDR family NAD(P)-dependent oxidoreductase n=1 Tax=Streptomyces sparsogenes TaxID=67365 RepID=UPI0033F98454